LSIDAGPGTFSDEGVDLTQYVRLYCGGVELPYEFGRRVTKVKVAGDEESASTAELLFAFEYEAQDLSSSELFSFKAEWVILFGTTRSLTSFGPFLIVEATHGFQDGVLSLGLVLRDLSAKMMLKDRQRKFSGRSLQALVKEIAEDYGLGYVIDGGGDVVFDEDYPVLQAGVPDATLLRKLADRYGYVLSFEGGALVFKQDRVRGQFASPFALDYYIGNRAVQSFNAKRGTRSTKKGAAAVVGGVDIKTGKPFRAIGDVSGDAESDSEPEDKGTERLGPLMQKIKGAEREARAGAQLSASNTVGTKKEQSVFDPEPGRWKPLPAPRTNESTATDTPQNAGDAARIAAASRAGGRSDVVEGDLVLSVPDTRIRVGDVVYLQGLTALMNGRWRVKGYSYEATDQGMSCSLSLGK
jgi:hypothetical protein